MAFDSLILIFKLDFIYLVEHTCMVQKAKATEILHPLLLNISEKLSTANVSFYCSFHIVQFYLPDGSTIIYHLASYLNLTF